MSDRCSTATYYEGLLFSVIDFGRSTDLVVRFRRGSNYYKLHVAWLGHLDDKLRLVQTYLVTSTKGDLLVVKRLLEGRKLRFKVFKWVESIALITEVDNIGDEAIFVGSNQSVIPVTYNWTKVSEILYYCELLEMHLHSFRIHILHLNVIDSLTVEYKGHA
ncbi:hypothetical protein ACLB2K_000584 [Fragaria x ananassa]